jgi:hypothetical protein
MTAPEQEDAPAHGKKIRSTSQNSDDPKIGVRVLEALRRLGCKGTGQREIRDWLIDKSVPEETAGKFSHTIAQWNQGNPGVESLLRLADLTGVSLDELLMRNSGPHVMASSEVFTPARGWFTDFLSKSRQIRCYVVSLDVGALQAIRTEATGSGDLTDSGKADLGRNWTTQFRVRDASRRMRDEHNLSDPLEAYRLRDLLEARMKWTEEVPVHGPLLAKLAKHQAYLGIYQALCQQRIQPFNRFPCIYHDDQGRTSLESLRVGSDSFPKASEPSWIIYYHWGPPVSEQDLTQLLEDAKLL